jgi:hypothetical protein
MGTWGPEPYAWTHFELRYGVQEPTQRRVLDQVRLQGVRLIDYRVDP